MCSLPNSVSSRVDRLPSYRRRGSTRVPLPPELALRAAPPENRGAQALLHTAGPCLKGSTPYLGTRVLPPGPDDAPSRRHGHGRDGPALQPDARRPRAQPHAHGAAHHVHSAARESNRRGASRIMASTPSTRRRLDSPVGSRPGSPSGPTRASRTSASGGKIPSSASGPSNSRRPVWKSRHRAGVASMAWRSTK